jgi:translocation and assembly module TamA
MPNSILTYILIFLLMGILAVPPGLAAEPVDVVISGIEGDALKNVQLALELPYGLVRGDKVDRLWLERFARQAEQEARTALEPFGYYHPVISTIIEPKGGDTYRLLVNIEPGRPTIINEVKIVLEGAGAREAKLQSLVADFPLKQGEALRHQDYEQAKGAIQSRAIDLGYLNARTRGSCTSPPV